MTIESNSSQTTKNGGASGFSRTATYARRINAAGALLSDSPNEDIPTVVDDLSFAEPLPLTNDSAQDAAQIHADLLSQGNRIQLPDVLKTARSAEATLVATNGHFERIDEFVVQNPRKEE